MAQTVVLSQPFELCVANFAYSFAYFLPGEELHSFVPIIGCHDKTISLQFLSPLMPVLDCPAIMSALE
jgi:hypothetical protein